MTLFLQFHLLQLGRGGGAEGLPIILIRGAPRSAKLQPRAESSRDSCWLIMNIFMAAQPGFALLLLAEPCYLSVYFGSALGVCRKAPESQKFGVRVSAVLSGSAALPHLCSWSWGCHVPGGGCVGPGLGPGSPTAAPVAKGALGLVLALGGGPDLAPQGTACCWPWAGAALVLPPEGFPVFKLAEAIPVLIRGPQQSGFAAVSLPTRLRLIHRSTNRASGRAQPIKVKN